MLGLLPCCLIFVKYLMGLTVNYKGLVPRFRGDDNIRWISLCSTLEFMWCGFLGKVVAGGAWRGIINGSAAGEENG